MLETISYLPGLWELAPGELIYMGTPDRVGPVVASDAIDGYIDGLGELNITIT